MNKKSVREMNAVQRRGNSIEAKTIRGLITISVLLGIALLVTGLGLYVYSIGRQYVRDAHYLSHIAASSVTHGTDVLEMSDDIMDRYRSLPEDQLNMNGTDEYREMFAEFQRDYDYGMIVKILSQYITFDEVSDVYIAMYDEQTCRMVYIVDPDTEGTLYPGEWEEVTR